MKHVVTFCSFLFVVQVCVSQVPSPLRTIMEVEYVGSNYALGTGMLGLGDINNDGKPDFAVSAGNIGQTFIYFGGKGVLDDVPDLTIKGGGLMAKGDLNGNGRMDLIVAGRETLYVYLGKAPSPLSIDTIPNLIIAREATGGAEPQFGRSFAVGDLNGDGFDDLVVGAPNYSSRGKVYVFLGKPNFNSMPEFSEIADSLCSFYGLTVQIADINGDGYTDLCIGSLVYIGCSGFPVDSRLDIFYGRIDFSFHKDQYNQRFDKSNTGFDFIYNFSFVDVNVDGFADLSYSMGDSAYFFYGRPDSLRFMPDFIIPNPDTSFYLSFAGPGFDIGDINGDGKKDFVMRLNPGGGATCIAVYLGSRFPSTVPVLGRCKGGNNPYHVIVPLGDLNDDGINDFGSVAPTAPFSSDGYFVIFSGDTSYVVSVHDQPSIPREISLSQNYPNPFNPGTAIEYALARSGHVVLTIYDLTGKEVKNLVNEFQSVGVHKVLWDGKTSSGARASTGVYYYTLLIDGILKETKKSVLLK